MRLPFTTETGKTKQAWFQYCMIASLPFSFYFLTLEQWIASMLMGHILAVIGQSVGHHRYFTHATFQLNTVNHVIISYMTTVLCIGSILQWRRLHAMHHMFSDTSKDPHPPVIKGKKQVFFGGWFDYVDGSRITKISEEIASDKCVAFMHKYYVYVILFHIAVLTAIDPKLLYAFFVFPTLQAITYGGYINAFLHKEDGVHDSKLGALITGGEGHHKTHHDNQDASYWPFPDLGGFVIWLIRKRN